MKKLNYLLKLLTLCSFLLAFYLAPLQAQLAAGQSKFLGNTHTQGQTPLNFDHYWNQLTPGNAGKWASCEQARDDFNYWLWLDRAYEHAKEFDIVFKEHTLVWGHSSGEPSWMSSVPQDEQMDEVLEWYQALSERYPDIQYIDVVNEPTHAPPSYTAALGGAGETGWDWVVWCYERAREYFPDATLILNEYNILNYTNECEAFLEIVDILQERGLIDAIGAQAHSLESIPFATIQNNLELLAATGLDIYISELELRGDDATQLALYQEIFPYLWEHPSVKGVTLWGYLEGDMWRAEAYLLAADGVTERPALQWLKDYFNFTDNTPGPYVMNTHVTGEGTVSLSPSGGSYDAGTTVTATATPASGYVFLNWSGDRGGSANPESIAMISNRSLTANFVEEGYVETYILDVSVSGNGSVTQAPEGTVFAEGAVVTLTATPDEDYLFSGWTGTVNSSSMTLEVTMESNTVLTASFTKIPGTGCVGEETISMNYEQNGIGEFCYVAQGTLGYISSWNMDFLEANGQNITNGWVNSIPASPDGLIHIHYVASVPWAHFEITGEDGGPITTFELSASITGQGSVEPASGTFNEGSAVEITANPAQGWAFSSWSGDASGTNAIITLIMDDDKSVVANFVEDDPDPVYYTVSTAIIGQGSISSVDGTYLEGTVIDISANPADGWVFSGWTGDINSSEISISFALNSDISVTANFIEDDPDPVYYTLTTAVSGEGTVTDGGSFLEGTAVSISATPATDWLFDSWSGDVSGTEAITSIIMDSDKSVTANFVEEPPGPVYYTLSIIVVGEGSVSDVAGEYLAGTDVSITATPASGYILLEWSGDATGNDETISVAMVADRSITATFVEAPPSGCGDLPTTVISLPFSHDGPGEYCWFTTDDISYVNSWAADMVTINDVDYSNVWSNSMPLPVDGGYYIYFSGLYGWSHFEAVAAKSAHEKMNNLSSVNVYPNPFNDEITIDLVGTDGINRIEILNTLGQLVQQIDATQRSIIRVNIDQPGAMFILKVYTKTEVQTMTLTKQ